MKELDNRLGWICDLNASKFYSHQNVDNWYYYVYQDTREGLPPNPIASRCAGRPVRGDVAVVRSAPEGEHGYDSLFSKTELLKTLAFYNTAKPNEIFAAREKSRFGRKMGFPPGYLDGTRHMHMQI